MLDECLTKIINGINARHTGLVMSMSKLITLAKEGCSKTLKLLEML
jgi:hypothetical protein